MKENHTYHVHDSEGWNLPEALRVTPFAVPTGYFNSLSEQLIAEVKLQNQKPNFLAAFTIPDQYFENLTVNLQAQVAWDTEELAQSNAAMAIPTGYFEQLTGQIQQQIKLDQRPQSLANQVPEGYFDGLSDSIQHKIAELQLKEQVQEEGFDVPDSYFESLSAKITARVASDLEQPILLETPVRRLGFQRWVQYAAAASVAAILSVSAFQAITDTTNVSNQQTLAAIPEDQLINYLASSSDAEDLLYFSEYIYQPSASEGVGLSIQDQDIEDYLNYTL